MGHTYSSNRIHVVFSTKERSRCISTEFQPKLWAYMSGIAKNQNFQALIVGGVEDHVHILLELPPNLALSKAIQFLKGSSSKWINDTSAVANHFAWQEGYGAFSVSASQTADVTRYIRDQRERHAQKTFEEEFLSLLEKYGVTYDKNACSRLVVSSLRDLLHLLRAYPALKRWAKLLHPYGMLRASDQ